MTQAPGMTADATSSSEDGLSISTDKDDYQPGDTVHFTGRDGPRTMCWTSCSTDEPQTHPPHEWTVNVGEDGTFQDSTYVVDEGDLDVTFTLLATSRATERWLSVTFTDANISNNVAMDPNPVFVARGAARAHDRDRQLRGEHTDCTAPLSVAGLPAGATGSFSPTVGHRQRAVTHSRTSILTITTTAARPWARTSFTVTATARDRMHWRGSTGQWHRDRVRRGDQARVPAAAATNRRIGERDHRPAVTVQRPRREQQPGRQQHGAHHPRHRHQPRRRDAERHRSQNAVNGVATFPGLSIDKIGNGYTLTPPAADSPARPATHSTSPSARRRSWCSAPSRPAARRTRPSRPSPWCRFRTRPAT